MKNEKKEKEKGVSLNKYKIKAELQSKRVQKKQKYDVIIVKNGEIIKNS